MTSLGPSLRRRPVRVRRGSRAASALALSLVLNLAALRLLQVDGVIGALKDHKVPQDVALAPLSAEAWEQNRRVGPSPAQPFAARPPTAVPVQPAPPKPTPPPEPPPTPRNPKGQVVDVGPSANHTPPKDSRFLSEEDNTVEKETRSRSRGPGYERTLPTPSATGAKHDGAAVAERPAPPAGQGGQGGTLGTPAGGGGSPKPAARPGVPATAPAPAPARTGEKLALRLDPRGEDARAGAGRTATAAPDPGAGAPGEPEKPPGPAEGHAGLPGLPGLPGAPGPTLQQLRPSASAYDRLAGGPAPDKLDGVEEGAGTFLNTRSWKYASYFNRMKRSLANAWDPQSAMRSRDPSGDRFGHKDWLTVLSIKLDDQGAIKDVAVARSSGLDFLDDTAVQAFRKAAPFANPPRGLADERGEIAFTFSFTYEVSGVAGLFGRPPRQ